MAEWQVFIVVFSVVLPLLLLGAKGRWHDDRLSYTGRPLPRDWDPQVTHPPSDEH